MENKQLQAFLLILKRYGYPNENLLRLSRSVGYDIGDLIPEFYAEFGLEKTKGFIDKGVQKLLGDDMTFRIDFGEGEYIVAELLNYRYDPDDDPQDVYGEFFISDSALREREDGELVTLDNLSDEYDPWDMTDLYDFLDRSIQDYFYENLGYRIVRE